MKKKRSFFLFITILSLNNMVFGQGKQAAIDYLHVSGPVIFDNVSYQLSWSSHPTTAYYKQEYLVKGDNASKFKTMILLELAVGNTSIKDIVNAKVEELKRMKLSNPVVNYEIINNPTTGEYMLDFLLSQNNESTGRAEIVERNVYRYKTYNDKNGKNGVILFGISTRSYGNDIDSFFASLKSSRKELLNKMSKSPVPSITVSP